DVTVTGAAASVPPDSFVVLVTLETGHFTSVQATADGSFTTSLFAPSGTSVLVKVDPSGFHVQRLLSQLQDGMVPGVPQDLSPLPGTILRVAVPPATGDGVPFGGAGVVYFTIPPDSPLPAWTFQGTINSQALQPGGTLRVQGTLVIVSPALLGAGQMQVTARLSLERLSGPDGVGSLAHNTFASVFLTPTGFPIERSPRYTNDGLDRDATFDLPKVAVDRAETVVDLSIEIPTNFLAGFYRPLIRFFFDGVPVEFPPGRPILSVELSRRPIDTLHLPVVQVGNPTAPRVFWTLLTDSLSNGTRGARAVEDQDRFGLASRILTQSETFIIPRVDPASGEPLTYRLEPFAPTVSLSSRRAPGPPLIPFRFPSGQLTVRIHKPDGSVDIIGPAPFVQARMRGLADRDGNLLDNGPHIADVYQLSSMDPRFEVQFAQDGRHVITLEGTIEDIWGNTWSGGGTYIVYVARTLSLDTAVLPGTPFEVGDTFNPGLVVSPPFPAAIEVRFRIAPGSDASSMVERIVRGRANRFGYFHASGIELEEPGEYRMDVTGSFRDEEGNLWMGARSWGGVVAPPNPAIIAHGRRGIEKQPMIGPQWFFRTDTGLPSFKGHVFFPFNSGDITWGQRNDSAFPVVTIQDPGGALMGLLRTRALDTSGLYFQVPFLGPGTFDERAAVGEVPLFSSRPDGVDPHFDPSRVDLWAYSYMSVQRPLVRVREEIGQDEISAPYWLFRGPYMAQIGVGRNGDLPNDIKFQYGGAVLHGSALANPHYAIYGSLFVLIPDDDPGGGTRTFPPFQGNSGGPSGGPIMTLLGRQIDLFIHLTGVRPGTVLEVGDTFALTGAVGPPLPALVSYTITKPDGGRLEFSGQANRVGYYYRPGDDFTVNEPGLYTVDLTVTYDGQTSAGP
ncbi:MAG: hypothetical protein V3U33_07395, partial [candidate division NC10 bacterium]